MFPIKRTVFFTTVTLLKNTVRLIGNIEYQIFIVVLSKIITRSSDGFMNLESTNPEFCH